MIVMAFHSVTKTAIERFEDALREIATLFVALAPLDAALGAHGPHAIIARTIHLAHAAGANGRENLVGAEPGTGDQTHQLLWNAGIICRAESQGTLKILRRTIERLIEDCLFEWLMEFSVVRAVFPLLDQLLEGKGLDVAITFLSLGISSTAFAGGIILRKGEPQ